MSKLITISELSKLLNLIDKKNGKPKNYILRYWEKEFKQIKPKIIRNRRYYRENDVKLIKYINYLIKDKGMTINGAKNTLNLKINKLDDHNSLSLKTNYYKINIEKKSKIILEKIKKIKNYGKKNSY
jgi:DNA-binding transcriptional MerR regulator